MEETKKYIKPLIREDLEKGEIIHHPILGRCQVLSIAKKHVRLCQLDFGGIVCKTYFRKQL